MLHMEEKGIPYNKMLLDEQALPEWQVIIGAVLMTLTFSSYAASAGLTQEL